MNVVTRVAIEGKAKQGLDGAGVKMYLKLSVPLDNVSPGQTIQLFAEENVKILDSICCTRFESTRTFTADLPGSFWAVSTSWGIINDASYQW
ncbi:hypothetical protein MPER_14673, partial [Moniliophthora perniciosa FA553]